MNILEIMQKAKTLKEDMEVAGKKLATTEVEGFSGGDMVRVMMTCDYKISRIKIDESIKDDISMIEDLVKVAVNDALSKVSDKIKDNMSSQFSGLGLPADFKLPF